MVGRVPRDRVRPRARVGAGAPPGKRGGVGAYTGRCREGDESLDYNIFRAKVIYPDGVKYVAARGPLDATLEDGVEFLTTWLGVDASQLEDVSLVRIRMNELMDILRL